MALQAQGRGSVQTFFWSRTSFQATSKQCESGKRFSRGGSVSCLLGGTGKAASVPYQENGIYNFGPQELSEYLTAKDSSSISAVLRVHIKHVTSLHGPLCHT